MLNYKPLSYIYETSNTKVIKVQDIASEKIYVLKLVGSLTNNLNQLIFEREINALKKLNKFDNIVKIYDYDPILPTSDGSEQGAILLEYIDGQDLSEFNLDELSELKKFSLCLSICQAVLNAHNSGILHRDLKPKNIMIVNEKVKIIDFGASKIKSIVEKNTIMPMFSQDYSAPEVVSGNETTELSDIYSLGTIFFEILLSEKASTSQLMISIIEKSILIKPIKQLLVSMIYSEAEKRLDNLNDAISIFQEQIGNLNISAYKFMFVIDDSKLSDLKKQNIIARATTMNQFTSVFLPKNFFELYGMYDDKIDIYKFLGTSMYMECVFLEDKRMFSVTKIFEFPIEKKFKHQKLFLAIQGRINFIESRHIEYTANNNTNLKIILENHCADSKTLYRRSELFEEIFGKWRESLSESIETIKRTNGTVYYNDFRIEDKKLFLTLKEYANNYLDNLTNENRYIFDETIEKKTLSYYVGTYEDIILEDSVVTIVISLDPKANIKKMKVFLEKKCPLQEDYQYKIMSFKKQINAITCLRNDECAPRSFKDIILELETPTSISNIKSIETISEELNSSQKEAVKKALCSDCISLIQGPPGTGKTKVIKEIIEQLMLKPKNIGELPKILIVSQSHNAVDNILESFDDSMKEMNIRTLRIGDAEKVSKKISDKFVIEAIRANTLTTIKEKSTQYIENQLCFDKNSDEWNTINVLHDEWLKRCGGIDSLDYQLVNSASIIAGTCIGFLSNSFVKEMQFDYVIVDEASKATTPELLVSIIKAKHIILVGDQKQLSPYADSELSPLSVELVKDPEFRLFDILFNILPESHKQVLTTQYRMIRNIGDLISNIFYEGTIITGIDDSERQHDIPFLKDISIVWLSTTALQNNKQQMSGGSFINISENNIIKSILQKMDELPNKSEFDIGVITGYSAQKNLLRKSISNCGFSNFKFININTLDSFQGRENDIIIYSTVRTDKTIGFQQERERINVAFSRARKLLIICGDMEFFYSWEGLKSNKFSEIINYMKENEEHCLVKNIEEGGDFFDQKLY